MELACNGRLCKGEYIKNYLHLKRFPCISLHCKLVPVQYWEYEYGLFKESNYEIAIASLGDWLKIMGQFSNHWEVQTNQSQIARTIFSSALSKLQLIAREFPLAHRIDGSCLLFGDITLVMIFRQS